MGQVRCYPEVVNVAQSFIEKSSAAAHLKRSNACMTTVCARRKMNGFNGFYSGSVVGLVMSLGHVK